MSQIFNNKPIDPVLNLASYANKEPALRKVPWKDFKGNDLFEFDSIHHPSGQSGIVRFYPDRKVPSDQWVVDYGFSESRLCLQVGDKEQAFKVFNS